MTSHFHSEGTQRGLWNAFPEVDEAIDAAMSSIDPAKRRELFAKAIKISADAYVSLVMGQVPLMAGLGPRVDIDFPMPAPFIAMFADRFQHKEE